LPNIYDSVVATKNILASEQTVVNFTLYNTSPFLVNLNGELTVTGMAIFNDDVVNQGIINGNATFNNNSFNQGNIIGDAIFNDDSVNNDGIVTGNATFNDNSFSQNDCEFGSAIFNDNSQMGPYTVVIGVATFTGSACKNGGTAGTFVPDPPPEC
jgi:hypothetical protein